MSTENEKIDEALTGAGEDRNTKRIQEAMEGAEYLYGLPEPEASYDDAVRAWAAKESLKGAAERYAHTGTQPLDDTQMEQIVAEMWANTNPDWSDLARLERTATIINRHAAGFENMRKR